ncbi:hypothetical protein FPCIR_4366 [Fusarium pseudocircinatum]|uniref:Uncharacterized protein n=1 Tax=Fusarium pseudocircinatum TaxID=56676 RepID=A0A8H5UQI5_9HYPO|nr:hypothetical protein FPCIR_4366 [Fusarium pseudocircinatum]
MSGINNETPPNALKSWQVRALAKGRTPLPESPGCRPWLETSSTQDVSEPGQQPLATTISSSASPSSTPGSALFMSESEMYHFPGRSIEALKQAYHKRRAIAEEQMRPVAIGKEDQSME